MCFPALIGNFLFLFNFCSEGDTYRIDYFQLSVRLCIFFAKGDTFLYRLSKVIFQDFNQLKQIDPDTRIILLKIFSVDGSRIFFSL